MRNYVYFGKMQRNISYRGCSFPVAPGCVIRCHPGFLENFLPPKEFKEAASSAKPKYTFPNSKSVFAQDPTGGLPMTSSEDPGPNFVRNTPSPATVADQEYEQLYDMRAEAQKKDAEEEPTLEESTSPEAKVEKAKSEVKKADKVDPPAAKDKTEDLPPAKKPGKKTKKKKTKAAPVPSGPAYDQPTKSSLRKLRKSELVKLAGLVVKGDAPRHPEMASELASFDEETHKTPIFDALWAYYDMDDAE